jgi:Sap-like sulfolipid-1-addressing protein
MPVQAIPLALIASLYPLGLAAVLLIVEGGNRPRAKVGVFLTGALTCTMAIGFVIVFALDGTGLNTKSQQSSMYGVRLAVGVLFMATAAVMARRPPRPDHGPSRMARAARDGGLIAVFAAGVALYLPSPAYLSALQVVGTTELDTATMAIWVVIVVALTLITVEVPVLLFLLAPGWTVPRLQAANAWLARNGHALLVWVLAAIGLWEFIDGLAGLL